MVLTYERQDRAEKWTEPPRELVGHVNADREG